MKRLLPILLFALSAISLFAEDKIYEKWEKLSNVEWIDGESMCFDYLNLSGATKSGLVSTFGEFVVLGDSVPNFSTPSTYSKSFTTTIDRQILVIHLMPDFGPKDGESCGQQDTVKAHITIIINKDTLISDVLQSYKDVYAQTLIYDLKGQTSFTFTIIVNDCAANYHYICCKMAIGCLVKLPEIKVNKYYCENTDSIVTLELTKGLYSPDQILYWHKSETPNLVYKYGTSITVPANQGNSYSYFWKISNVFVGQPDTIFKGTVDDSNSDAMECPTYEVFDTTYIFTKTQPTMWHNKVLVGPGVLTDSLSTRYGCDSVVHLRVKLVQTIYQKDTTCLFPYLWHGQQLTQSGNYQSEQIYGAVEDTVFYLNLAYKACDPHEWQDGNPLNPTILVCDTAYSTMDTTIYCDSLLWFDKWYYTTGIYHDTIFGGSYQLCDSIGTLDLKVLDTSTTTDTTAYTCYGVPFIWHGKAAVDGDTIMRKNINGCDSIVTLKLFVSEAPVTIPLKDTASCQMVPFTWRGHAIVGDTTCYDTIRTTKLGCDSIYASLRFVTLASGSSEVTKVICDKQLPYPWKDLSCTKEGDYTFDTLTTHGCDSTITLHLIVKDHAENDTTAYICNKDLPFIWHGKVAQNGDTIMRKNAVGCDSIVTLKLFVSAAPVTLPQKDTTSCHMIPFMWRGHQIVGDTLCYDTLRTTKLGCDSIYASLRFVVKEPSASDTTAYTCYGTPFIWHGKEAKDGDTIMLINSVGCDSIVTLRLTTSAKPIVWSIDTTICDTLLPFTWRDIFYTSVLTWRDTIHNAQGCDSIYRSFTLDTIHCVRPEPPVPPEPPVDTCLSDLVYKKWVDLIFCDNGKDDFVAYQWYRDEQALSGETRQYLYLPSGMGPAEYFVEVTYVNGQHMRTCPKTFDNIPRSADTYVKMPTVIRRGESIHIELSDAEARIRFYDAAGRLIREEMVYNHSDLPQSFLPGAYVAEVDGEHVHEAVKMIVY